jgi:hypothetical protein
MREAWFNLHENGWCCSGWISADAAKRNRGEYTGSPFVECRRITWMSDGSPVPGEAPEAPWKENSKFWRTKCEIIEKRQAANIKELIRWKQECKSAQAERDALKIDLESRILECKAARDVIAALKAERDAAAEPVKE